VVRVLAIADDLTGALEAGAKFAERGMDAAVTTRLEFEVDAAVTVVDTESRHIDADAAAARVAACARPASLIYKKTDSTLRGNIGPELGALRRAYPEARMTYVPAYPALRRTVRRGRLYVDGVPVHETEFGRDLLNPVGESRVREAVGADFDCEIVDGETDADVGLAAERILAAPGVRIVAGPAAIAGALAERIAHPVAASAEWPRVRECLVVNGSRHPASAAQVEYALARGCLSPEGPWRLFERSFPPNATASEVARATGLSVADSQVDALMVLGGDTAYGILEALGLPLARPMREVLPGVPVSRVDGFRPLLVSKAGGFGAPALLCRLREILDSGRAGGRN
jgi:uncharacterized protein YgbK (DUF1537 family)